MEILGVGISELIFILIIAALVLGPKDMEKTARNVGRWLNTIIKSDGWKTMQSVGREIRTLPTRLMKDANMDMHLKEKPASPPELGESPAPKPPPRSQPYSSEPAVGAAPEYRIAPDEIEKKETEHGQPDNA